MKLKFLTQLSIAYLSYHGRTFCAFYVVKERTPRDYPVEPIV